MSDKSPIGIGMIGCGTVGSGVVKLLVENHDLLEKRLGCKLMLRKVLVREKDLQYKTEQVPAGCLTTDPEAFFATPDMPILIELGGGRGPISQFVRRAISQKKNIVTANKALLAAEGPELFALARKEGVTISFEASCGGGIPCLTALQFGLMANRIDAIYGILNGTCNYILTQMTQADKAYAVALKEAQDLGYAEADPTLDVSGKDAAAKLAIVASLAFGVQVSGEQVSSIGIDKLDLDDVRHGAELGYDIKLLGIAERKEKGILIGVQPCFVSKKQLLAQVHGSFNALSVFGHAVGHVMFYGRGAGQMPTSSAVMSDVMNAAAGLYQQGYRSLSIWPDQQEAVKPASPDDLVSRFYIRLNVKDVPGVMAQVSTALGQAGISLSAVVQHEAPAQAAFVPIVVLTHAARQGDLQSALAQIQKLDVVSGQPVCIRIVDMPVG